MKLTINEGIREREDHIIVDEPLGRDDVDVKIAEPEIDERSRNARVWIWVTVKPEVATLLHKHGVLPEGNYFGPDTMERRAARDCKPIKIGFDYRGCRNERQKEARREAALKACRAAIVDGTAEQHVAATLAETNERIAHAAERARNAYLAGMHRWLTGGDHAAWFAKHGGAELAAAIEREAGLSAQLDAARATIQAIKCRVMLADLEADAWRVNDKPLATEAADKIRETLTRGEGFAPRSGLFD